MNFIIPKNRANKQQNCGADFTTSDISFCSECGEIMRNNESCICDACFELKIDKD